MIARRLTSLALASLCALAGILALSVVPSQAQDIHNYLFQFGEVPAVGPHNETITRPGPVTKPNAMTLDSGEVYVAEGEFDGVARVDKYNAATGAFIAQFPAAPPQVELPDLGIAVGHATSEPMVYLGADEVIEGTPHGVIIAEDATGKTQSIWKGTETASKVFRCFQCVTSSGDEVAVDDSPGLGDWAANDVYVADPENNVVDVFEPETGGGETPVAELTGISPTEPFRYPYDVAVSPVNGDLVVADEADGVNVFTPGALPGQYEFVAKLVPPSGVSLSAEVKIDVSDGEGGIYVLANGRVLEFNSVGAYQGQITPESAPGGSWGSSPNAVPENVTADPITHQVYVGTYSGGEASSVFVFGPNVVIPDVATGAASSVEPESATLNGTVDLNKAGAATCLFEWGTSELLGEVASCSAKVEGEGQVPVSAVLTELQPDTTYYYRLQATNANGTNREGLVEEFTTPGPGLADESVSEVASASATLDATINPNASPTSYYFQYGKSSKYELETPAAPGVSLGSGVEGVEVGRHLQGLAAGTVYHYRVVVVSELEVEPGVRMAVVFPEPDRTFTTQPTGVGLVLPDGRQWELVTPPDKHGGTLEGISIGPVQASPSGDMVTDHTLAPTENTVDGNLVNESQLLASRSPAGWSSQDIAAKHKGAAGLLSTVSRGAEITIFSEDLSIALYEPHGLYTSQAPEASPPDTGYTPYLRHDFTCGIAPASCFEPLLTSAPGFADVIPGSEFGGDPRSPHGAAEYIGSTPDFSHVLIRSGVPLTENGGTRPGLYEWSAAEPPTERLQFVSAFPEGEGGGPAGEPELGYKSFSARYAISNDGSRVVWENESGSSITLYLRDTVKDETVRLDAVQGGSGKGTPKAAYQIASSDGSKVFFTDTQPLTEDSGTKLGVSHLYECEIIESKAGKLECALSDLAPEVQGAVLGASEDASYLYFVSTAALTSVESGQHEKASAGADNLYMLHYDSAAAEWEAPKLIGVLSGEDENDWALADFKQPTRVTADGRYLAFMSDRSLTGYNNHDAHSGAADQEVFLFDAHSGHLVCVSCNPDGARPEGSDIKDRLGAGYDRVWGGTWMAANVPGWTPYSEEASRYQSRYLSAEGRLFFNSTDALVPQDVNKNEDAYEYEPAGVGSCSTGSVTYAAASGGCVELISSGASAQESAFLDASENGNDVFFMTTEKLVPQDIDTAYDIYDGHACTSESPCINQAVLSPACITADACRAAPAAQPPLFGAPASATFSGAGNVTPSTPAVQPRSLTRAQKLARALTACRKQKAKKKRAACERRAQKRYGVGQSRKANATKRGRG